MNNEINLPVSWADGWDGDELPQDSDDEFSGGKYVDCQLYDASGEEVIPIRIDHYERIWDSALPLKPSKAWRDYIATACNEHPKLKARIERLEAALRKIAEQRDSAEHGAFMRAEGHAEEDDSDESCADYMAAHDYIIHAAREALETP